MRQIKLMMCAVILAGATMSASAQQIDYSSKHEIGISYGAGNNSRILNSLDGATTITAIAGQVSFDNSKRFGSISGEYFYRIGPLVAVGAIVSYSHHKKDVIMLGSKQGENKMNYFTLLPSVKLDWLRRSRFGLYSKIGLGVTLRAEKQTLSDNDSNYSDAFFNWQASLIGAEFGNERVRAFTELGCGEQGIFLVGVRCKF